MCWNDKRVINNFHKVCSWVCFSFWVCSWLFSWLCSWDCSWICYWIFSWVCFSFLICSWACSWAWARARGVIQRPPGVVYLQCILTTAPWSVSVGCIIFYHNFKIDVTLTNILCNKKLHIFSSTWLFAIYLFRFVKWIKNSCPGLGRKKFHNVSNKRSFGMNLLIFLWNEEK